MSVPARIVDIRQGTPSIKLFRLDLGGGDFTFLPGQWVDCYANVDGELRVAGYSMTSSPLTTGTIDLAVKLEGDNPVTHFLHERAMVGDMLEVDGGHGNFSYRRGMGDSLVLIGGGIGLTPLMSIIRYVDDAEPEVGVTLVHSARRPSELLFHQQLTEIAERNDNIRCLFTVTRQSNEPWSGSVGRISAEMLAEAHAPADALFYLCGPPYMVQAMVNLLATLGVLAPKIAYESW